MLRDFSRDILHGFRMLRRAPGFALVAILTLAIAIASNTTVFSLVNSILLLPLPYDHPEQLALVWGTNHSSGQPRDVVSGPNYLDLRDRSRSFTGMAAFTSTEMTVQRESGAGVVPRLQVTPDFFSVLGVSPHLGQIFRPEDGYQGPGQVAVLSYEFWQREFSADPGVVGKTLSSLGQPHTVIGILPPHFAFFVSPDVVTPLQEGHLRDQERTHHHYWIVSRLLPGVSVDEAEAELDTILGGVAREYPNLSGWEVTVDPLQETLVESVRPALWMILAAVSLLFVIACANVSNLILMRDLARRQELAVRAALGAGRSRLIRQLLAEGACLAAVGGGLGSLLSVWLIPLTAYLLPTAVPIPGSAAVVGLAPVTMDGWTLAYGVMASTLAVLILGLLSAWKTAGFQPVLALQSSTTRTTGAPGDRRTRNVLVAIEVALATVLVAGMGLMVRTVMELQQVDAGFRKQGVVTMMVGRLHDRTPAQRAVYYGQVLEQVRGLSGVEEAGWNDYVLLRNEDDFEGFHLEGRPLPERGHFPREEWRRVSPGYFKALRIPLLRGRRFTRADTEKTESVVLVNQAAARKYWPGEDPVGRRIVLHHGAYDSSRIVGIVGDVRYTRLEQPAKPMLYVPYHRAPRPEMGLFVKMGAGIDSTLPGIREAIRSVDATQPIAAESALETIVTDAISVQRLTLWIAVCLALVSVLLAAVGVFGVNAYAVGQRTRELGIRMAMGARRPDIFRLILIQGLPTILLGVGIGLALTALLSQALRGLLYGVTPHDPFTLLATPMVLLAAGLVACLIPARRALRIDPAVALRSE